MIKFGGMNMFMKPKVNEIIKRRTEAGMSQHQVALKSNLGGCALSRIESGATTAIHPLRAKAIAKTLNCKVSDIFDK